MKSLAFALSALLFASSASAAKDDLAVSVKSLVSLAKTLEMMGYPSEPSLSDGGYPILTIRTADTQTAIVFGGCEKETNCKYIVLVTSFTDVKSPPEAWLQKLNADYDLLKVALNEDKTLRISHGAIVEGLPVSSFRKILDEWVAAVTTVAKDAMTEKLVSGK